MIFTQKTNTQTTTTKIPHSLTRSIKPFLMWLASTLTSRHPGDVILYLKYPLPRTPTEKLQSIFKDLAQVSGPASLSSVLPQYPILLLCLLHCEIFRRNILFPSLDHIQEQKDKEGKALALVVWRGRPQRK